MKTLLLFFTILSIISCNTVNKGTQVLTDKEWREIIENTLFLAEGDKPLIFKEYNNCDLKDKIAKIYINNTDLGYEYNDSILNVIYSKKNKTINNKLDTMYNVKFITDTINNKQNYVIYSEPFYVNKDIICISMTNKIITKNTQKNWIFFLKKQNGTFKIIEFYDVNNDKYYRPMNN